MIKLNMEELSKKQNWEEKFKFLKETYSNSVEYDKKRLGGKNIVRICEAQLSLTCSQKMYEMVTDIHNMITSMQPTINGPQVDDINSNCLTMLTDLHEILFSMNEAAKFIIQNGVGNDTENNYSVYEANLRRIVNEIKIFLEARFVSVQNTVEQKTKFSDILKKYWRVFYIVITE